MVENKYVDDSMNKEHGGEAMNTNKENIPDDVSEETVETASADARDPVEEQLRELTEQLKKRDEEIASMKDLMQRRQADFENYKKRNVKQQEEQKKMAVRDIALDIIAINDDLLRAIDAAATIPQGESLEHSHQSFVDGVGMISRRIEEALAAYGIIEVDTLNEEFDPCLNEAVEIVMSDGVDRDTVTKIYQKGFKHDDYVLRHAKVQVSRSTKQQNAGEAAKECAPGADAS